jgi:predicted glycogen debranching enzyme
MHLNAHTLRDRDRSLATEWLLADGAGGYASSTVLLCGARRYHGLWVPALKPPVDRRVILSHLEERLVPPGGDPLRPIYLSTTEYGGGFFPDGTPWADSFDLEPLPRLVSRAGGLGVEREVLLLRDGAGVCLAYRVTGRGRWTLDLAPMLALRSMHALAHNHGRFRIERLDNASGFRCLCEGLPGVFLWADDPQHVPRVARPGGSPTCQPVKCGGPPSAGTPQPSVSVTVSPVWYYNVLRRVERERGFDHCEDVLTPGHWTVSADGPAAWHVFCSFDPPRPIDVAAERQAHLARQADLVTRAGGPKDERLARLVRAADAFIVRRRVGQENLATVIAGYHWFGDWGRDTLIALPGLAMETGRLDVAEKVLRAFAAATSAGMVLNCYAEDTGQPLYNTVDASLWFIQAMAAYARAGGREDFIRDPLWPAAAQICRGYRDGTRYGICADADGLITAGSPDTQLTWMDATAHGRPVTPRYGKAVEINALWISGLTLAHDLAGSLGLAPPASVTDLACARRAFEDLFWNEAAGCLYDCVLPDGTRDPSVRPNQIFAVGLPHAPLTGERARAVVRTVREKLLTPRGLRTLSPDDPAYCGRYAGGPDQRDAAYHQGTAWPWLLGPYVDAVFAVEDAQCARSEARQILDGLLDSMEEAGLGHISEVFDGDPPHRPGGCIAQAWSVAAAIHIWKRLEATGGMPQ